MKQIIVLFALLQGVCAANAQETDTVKYAAGNDLYRDITRKLPYRQMVTSDGVEVTSAKTVHIISPRRRPLRGFGKQPHHIGQGGRSENVILVKPRQRVFWAKRTFPPFARMAVSFRSVPNIPVNQKCSTSK